MKNYIGLSLLLNLVSICRPQDYQVADISCDFDGPDSLERLSARIKKPPEFKGHPLFADQRKIDPSNDPICKIIKEEEPTGLIYNLEITDFEKCGASRKKDYVHLRVWFPQIERVVLATDQEVVIMCKPASPTIIENRAAGFAGSLPSAGRVSGVVEESPGTLEYEVALFRELSGRKQSRLAPVDQAVPIGERLQLRARINTESPWKYAKLLEVTVSNSPKDPYFPGYVALVQDGCRISDFTNIVPEQPRRVDENPGEVRLDFEAFMLDATVVGSAQLWIHATIKACIQGRDCLPEFCLDLFHPAGHGRRKREGNFEVEEKESFRPYNYQSNNPGDLWITSPRKKYNYRGQNTESFAEQIIPTNLSTMVSVMAGTKSEESGALLEVTNGHLINKSMEFVSNVPPKFSALKNPKDTGPSAKVGDNVGLTVIMPEEFFNKAERIYESCVTFMVLSGVLGAVVLFCVTFLCFLTLRVQKSVDNAQTNKLDNVIKEHNHKYGVRDFLDPPFQ